MSKLRKRLARFAAALEPAQTGAPPDADERVADSKAARIRALQRQLDRMVVDGRRARPAVPTRTPSDTLARLLRDAPSLRSLPPEEQGRALPGERETTAHGELHVVRQWLEPAHHHGRTPVEPARRVQSDLLARLALDPTLGELDPQRMLLIDTETTGLSTGAGTLPFLVGVGFFDDASLCIEQLLLTRRADEPTLLRVLADRIAEASFLVSYNGKSFDWPLLRSRFVMNRIAVPPIPPHLDLLHCARRAFKRRLRSMRLVEMEREILGMVREHDVGGAEIPSIYLTFLRSGEPGRLDGVIEHNGHDLVALAAFLGEILRRFDEVQREDDPRDHLSYALIAERSGDGARAAAFASAAVEGGGDEGCAIEACLLAARVARRARSPSAEHAALLQAAALRSDPRVHLALAKYYEHRAKDLARALEHARQTSPMETAEEVQKRVQRLERRIERAQMNGSTPRLL